MSGITFSTKDDSARLSGMERAYASVVCRDIARGIQQRSGPSSEHEATWEQQLNTAVLIGNDALCWLARLHAQCEIHGFVEGPNRSWLAGIITDGRGSGLLREGMGWEAVVELLLDAADTPVVTDYSVTESFPSEMAAGWAGYEEPREDAWYDLSHGEQWDLAVNGIRMHGSEWKPDSWRTPNFSDGSDVLTKRWEQGPQSVGSVLGKGGGE